MKTITLAKQQSGAVLVIALVVLLVMSVVAISSKVNTALQQKMATSQQQRTIANLAAEAGLRAGENFLTTQVKSTQSIAQFSGAGNKGLYANYRLLGVINN